MAAAIMEPASFPGFPLAARADQLRAGLRAVPGLELQSGHRGWLRCGRRKASVCVESMDCIRVVLHLDAAPWGLQQELPGNLRMARNAAGPYAVADLQTDAGQLGDRFADLVWGLSRLLRRRPPRAGPDAWPAPGVVQAALAGMAQQAGEVVELEEGFELRPRVSGRAVAVRARTSARGLHLWRRVLDPGPEDPAAAAAVADQAQRCNARLRWARVTAADGGIAAETCLPAELITPPHLSRAARAVAAAAHHTTTPLAVLARSGPAAGRYVQMFVNNARQGEKP